MNITTYKQVVKELSPAKKSILALGRPGCGKSEAVEQMREEMGLEGFIDLRLGLRDPSEIKGVIGIDPVEKISFQTLPDYFPQNQKTGILHLDELPQAPALVQSAGYQLFQERRIGKFKLPDGWIIIASGNRKVDGGVHFKIPPALVNRLIVLNIEASFDEWLNHAISKCVSPDVTGFHKFTNGKYLYHEDPNANSNINVASFCTPRSWFSVDNILESDYISTDYNLLREVLQGTLSQEAAGKFVDYFKIASNAMDYDTIDSGNFSDNDVNSMPSEALYSTLTYMQTYAECLSLKEIKYSEGVIKFISMVNDPVLKSLLYNTLNSSSKNTKKLITPNGKDDKSFIEKIIKDISPIISKTN